MIFIIMREMDPFPDWEMEIFNDFHEHEENGSISQLGNELVCVISQLGNGSNPVMLVKMG